MKDAGPVLCRILNDAEMKDSVRDVLTLLLACQRFMTATDAQFDANPDLGAASAIEINREINQYLGGLRARIEARPNRIRGEVGIDIGYGFNLFETTPVVDVSMVFKEYGLGAVLTLAISGQVNLIRNCEKCNAWYSAKRSHARYRFCSERCRRSAFRTSSEQRKKNAEDQRRRYAQHKELDRGALEVARRTLKDLP